MAATSALDISATSDLDGSVWQQAAPPAKSRSVWNRPAKRQSGGWEPPAELSTPLKEVWDHCLDTYTDGLFGFKNFGWDQLMATDG
ncbi:hypothetical protein IMZ48_07875 [Candidatus Bathyarchaeota archaeon]|nr:hypothetical protein [Candidatus Bathyarchaeota archaeon]